MAYGITVTGTDDIFMVNSEDAAGCVLATLTDAPVTISAGASASSFDTGGGDLIMAQPSATSTYGTTTAGYGHGLRVGNTGTHLRATTSVWTSAAPTFASGTRYVILQSPENAGNNNPNGDYGLQVYNSAGTKVIFDSRKFTRGMLIERVWDPGTLAGGSTWATNYVNLDGSTGTADMSNRTLYTATGADAAAKTADMQEIYVTVASNFGGSLTTTGVTNTSYYNTVYYNYDEHKIFHYGYFPAFSATGVGGYAETPMANTASIIVGRIIQ
jgi:hypothetical protein